MKMTDVCLSVRLSAVCLDITRERKGLGSPKLAGWKPVKRLTCEPILRSKGQGSRSQGHKCNNIAASTCYVRVYMRREVIRIKIKILKIKILPSEGLLVRYQPYNNNNNNNN